MRLFAKDLSLGQRFESVSATFEPGTMTAICGPNGAGKSSLLATLAGLHRPCSGTICLGEGDLANINPRHRARAMGYLPQSAEVAWDVSVASLVALGRLPHGDRGETAVAQAIAQTDLAALARRPVSTLSGGEKARALLARVLAGKPQWILADEPLAALDLAHQLAMLAHLRTCANKGAGIIIVLHDLALAMNHCDRVLVLDRGHCVADDAPEQALTAALIARVWNVQGDWLGEPGSRAFAARV